MNKIIVLIVVPAMALFAAGCKKDKAAAKGAPPEKSVEKYVDEIEEPTADEFAADPEELDTTDDTISID